MAATDLSRLPLEEQSHLFVTTLFDGLEGFLDLRFIAEDKPPVRQALPNARAVEKVLSNGRAEGYNVYLGNGTCRSNSVAPGAGSATELHSTCMIPVDIDFKKKDDIKRLNAKLKKFPFNPAMVVNSGNGLHLYFRIKPHDLHTESKRTEYRCISQGVCEFLGGDRSATGPARVWRVPGTTNYPNAKKRAAGCVEKPATLIGYNSDDVYNLEDFAGYKIATKNTPKRTPKDVPAFDGTLPKSVKALLRPKRGKLWERWNGDTTGLADTSESGIDQSLANLLALAGIGATEIIHATRYRRAEAGADPKHDGYYALTAGKALDWAAKQKKKSKQKLKVVPDPPHDSDTPPEDATDAGAPLEDPTDAGLAAAFIRHHGPDLLHLPTTRGDGPWYVWDGTRYRRDEGNEVRRMILETATSLIREAADEPNPDRREEILKMAWRCRSSRGQRDALWIAASDPAVVVRSDELDSNPWLFNFANGTLDLKTGKLRPHRREDRITKISPVAYDRNAKAPLWEKTLKEVQPDPKMRAFLRRALGYCLTGSTREEVIFIFWGGGCNGKTVLIETVRACVGSDYAIELSTNALVRSRYGEELERALVPLPRIRLATTTELREGQQLNAQLTKRITSGEPVRVRALYKESSEFHPECKVIMATNHKPRVSEDDDGTWRRLRLIPFNQKIPADKVNQNLRAELREELPGVVAWMVRGCLEWQKRRLDPPKSVLAATDEYRSDEDYLSEFLDECTTENAQACVLAGDLGAALGIWFKRSGGKYVPSSKAIAERLKNRKFVKKRLHGKRGWRGLDLTREARGWLNLDPTRRVSDLIEMEKEHT